MRSRVTRRPTRRSRGRRAAGTCARCSTSSARRSSSSASCSRPGPTSCRPTSSPSCAACRTTSGRSRTRTSSGRSRKSSASRSSACSPSSTTSRSQPRRSGRCTARRCRTGAGSWSRCSGRTRRGRSRPTSRCMYQAARLAKERIRALDFVDAGEIVDEFARSIRQELDYRLEARNADAFHKDFAGHPHVAVPRVYWTYTRSRVLTLEYLDGVQLADLELDAWSLEQRRHLAYLITETWMTMIFRNGFFHARPASGEHPRALPGAHRARRLRPDGEAHRRRHDAADAALHRRRVGEHRDAAEAACSISACAIRRSARRSSSRSCATCTTATTARA